MLPVKKMPHFVHYNYTNNFIIQRLKHIVATYLLLAPHFAFSILNPIVPIADLSMLVLRVNFCPSDEQIIEISGRNLFPHKENLFCYIHVDV